MGDALKSAYLRATAIRNLAVDQRAYLAGFIDGEGNINITILTNKSGHVNSALTVTLYNCDLNVLKTIQSWVGIGSIMERKRASRWRTAYSLKWRGRSAVDIIEAAYPFLIIKKRQAEIAFEYANTIDQNNLTGASWHGGRKLKPEILSRRLALKAELQSLTGIANFKGKQCPAVMN